VDEVAVRHYGHKIGMHARARAPTGLAAATSTFGAQKGGGKSQRSLGLAHPARPYKHVRMSNTFTQNAAQDGDGQRLPHYPIK